MKRLVVIGALLVSSCHDKSADSAQSCKLDHDCPFQQCCVAGTCADPGLVGVCEGADAAHTTLTSDAVSPRAGVDTVNLTAILRDAHNRPITSRAVSLSVNSDCGGRGGTCDVLTPGSGSTDKQGHFQAALTTHAAGAKTLTLSTGTAAIATLQVTFGTAPDGSLSFGDSSFGTTLGNSLANVHIGVINSAGDFTTSASSKPIDVSLVANGASVVLTDANAVPLASRSLSFDVASGAISLGSAFVPIAGSHFQLQASLADGSQTITSPPFQVTTAQVLDASASPPSIDTPGGSTTISWSTAPFAASELASVLGVVAENSPATVQPDLTTSYEIFTVDARPSPLRTAFVDANTGAAMTGSGQVHVAFVTADTEGGLFVGGEYTASLDIDQDTILQPMPSGKSGATSFILHTGGPGNAVSAWYALSADDSRIKGFAYDSGQLVVVLDYDAVSASWQGSSAPLGCTVNGSGGQRATEVVGFSGSVIEWCRDFRTASDQKFDVNAGGVAMHNGTVYVLMAAGPKVLTLVGGSDQIAFLHGSGGSQLAVATLGGSGSVDAFPYVEGDYTFAPGGIVYTGEHDQLVIYGGAIGNTSPVFHGSAKTFTTSGMDAIAIGAQSGAATWAWNSASAGDDLATGGGIDFAGDFALAGTFTSPISSLSLSAPADGTADAYVTVLNNGEALWTTTVSGTVSAVSLVADDNQIITTTLGSDALSLAASVAAASSASHGAVGLATAFRWGGQPLWSKPLIGAQAATVQPTADGGAWVGVDGSTVTIGPLDPTPLTLSSSVQFVIGNIVPYDYALLDIAVAAP